VADRHAAAADVDLAFVDLERLEVRQGLRRERFVQLEEIDVIDGELVAFEPSPARS
jgi:hypothetical protein